MNALTFNNGTVKPGDVFAASWGYEQTNVTFYQVISLHGKKTVTVREIRGECVFTGGMSGETKPVINDFTGEPLKRQIKTHSDRPVIHIEEYETAYQCKANAAHYFSMYA